MPTVTTNYTAETLTITLTSLGIGAARQSNAFDNDNSKNYVDAIVGGSIQVGSVSAAGSIEIYAFGSYDGVNFTGGAGASDAAYTIDGREATLKLLDVIATDATANVDYEWGAVSVAAAFGGVLPQEFGIVIVNNTGAALHATGTNNELKFAGVKYVSA